MDNCSFEHNILSIEQNQIKRKTSKKQLINKLNLKKKKKKKKNKNKNKNQRETIRKEEIESLNLKIKI